MSEKVEVVQEVDSIFFSKRTYAALSGGIVFFAGIFGMDFDADMVDQLDTIIATIGGVVTVTLSLWSKAKQMRAEKKSA